MQDRIPLYPGRVTLTPVSGQANTYDMARADQPTEEGTPLNKNTLLKDATAALYGLGSDAVPDDVLGMLGDSIQLEANAVPSCEEKTIGQFSVGQEVKINENGGLKSYIVIQQGKPSALYDDSCDGTWLMRKDLLEEAMAWSNTADGTYSNSLVHEYLNSTFIETLPDFIKQSIVNAKIPFISKSGVNNLNAKSFVLSYKELGWYQPYGGNDGAPVDYFPIDSDPQTKIAYSGGNSKIWWTRSPYGYDGGANILCVSATGYEDHKSYSSTLSVRPVIILPSDRSFFFDNQSVMYQEQQYENVYSLCTTNGNNISDEVSEALKQSVKTLKTVVTQQEAQQVSVDVSDIDFDAYDEVIVYVEFENATASNSPSPFCYVQVNGVDDASENRYGYWGDDRFTSTQDVGDVSHLAYIGAVSDKKRYQCRPAKLRFQKRGQYLFCQSEFGYYQINSAQFYSRTEAGMFRLLDDPSITSLQFSAGVPDECTLKSGGKLRFLGVKK